jgi:hypothetical protein
MHPYLNNHRTTRQVRRLARRYAAAGPVGLISRRFSRPSNNHLDEALADRDIKILRSTYADFGPTLATERKLRTKHGIDLATQTPRRLQIAALRAPRWCSSTTPRAARERNNSLMRIYLCIAK